MAKKKPFDEAIRRGLSQLGELGLDVGSISPALIKPLEERFGKSRELDLAIAFALGKIADPAAAEALARLEKQTAEKDVQKEIRRSLFKLTQKGISLLGTELDERTVRPVFSLTPEIEGYLSSVDGVGGRLVWLVKPQAGSGIQLLQGMVNDREGLQRVGGTRVRRKELRRMIDEIKQNHGVTMISIPWEYGDRILYEGYEKAKALGRGGTENFFPLRSTFTTDKPKKNSHPVYGRLRPEEARSGAWRELSRRLLDEPELRAWILDEDWVGPYLGQLHAAQESRLVLNPMQKEERLAAIVREAVGAIFRGESGNLFQRRMEDMALYFLETGRDPQAKLALAVALQLREGDLGPLDISFLTGLAQKSFAFYASREKARAEEEPSLIVKP